MTSPAWQHPSASADRHAGLRRDRADRLAPRRRRPPGRAAGHRGHGAARLGQRRAGRRDRAHRGPARWRCAGRWCRAIPSRPAPSAWASPHLKADAEGFVDTFYACRLDRMTGTVAVTGPPPGVVSVGGYRFRAERTGGPGRGAPTAAPSSPPCPTRSPDTASPAFPAAAATCARRWPGSASIRSLPMPFGGATASAAGVDEALMAARVHCASFAVRVSRSPSCRCKVRSSSSPTSPPSGLAQAFTDAGAFPIVEASWAGAPTAAAEVKPSAIVLSEPDAADRAAAAALARHVAGAVPFIPMVIRVRDDVPAGAA